MSKEFNLTVSKRELVNKGQRKKFRKEGKVPGVFYSHDSKESILFYIEYNELNKAQKADTRIFSINVNNKKRNVLFKSVQYHPVTDEILHLDLYGIKMDQIVALNVSIQLFGTAKGVIEGGIVVQTLNELQIECFPMDIPTSFKVDISELEIGDNLKVEDIKLDSDKITVKSNTEQIIVSITQAMKEEELIPQIDEDEELLEGEEGEEADEGGEEADEGGEEATKAPEEKTEGDESTKKKDKKDSKG